MVSIPGNERGKKGLEHVAHLGLRDCSFCRRVNVLRGNKITLKLVEGAPEASQVLQQV